jgi:glycosyltransferase involved in cell wall biosynthesis
MSRNIPPELVIATMLREAGPTGVHTHVRQLRQYLAAQGVRAELVTPFSWARPLTGPIFGARVVVDRLSRPASVVWYRYWHELFLRRGLRRALATAGPCVVYTQGPPESRAALAARQGPHQRVVQAVHFRISQADEWADKGMIARDGIVFRRIRRLERAVLPRVDGLMYVSDWARTALAGWLPEAAAVPSTVIDNFVSPVSAGSGGEPLADLVTMGHLEPVKNHRYMLEVLAEAARTGRRYTLDVYGVGPLRGNLLRQATALGLDGQVRFRGFDPGVRSLLPRYRAYSHASYSESSSLAIIESMAAGLPIVAGNIGPIAELCTDGVEARFWPLDDPAKAAAVLSGLLDSEPDRLRAAAAAQERFRREFDTEVIAPRLWAFLRESAPDVS